jgi:hypothetical protein
MYGEAIDIGEGNGGQQADDAPYVKKEAPREAFLHGSS